MITSAVFNQSPPIFFFHFWIQSTSILKVKSGVKNPAWSSKVKTSSVVEPNVRGFGLDKNVTPLQATRIRLAEEGEANTFTAFSGLDGFRRFLTHK
jgi:hypothetical protein